MAKVLEFDGGKRRKGRHFLVKVTYIDSQSFGRIFRDIESANRFADRQKNVVLPAKTGLPDSV